MEIIEEFSSDSTISNISDSKDSSFLFDSEDLLFMQKPNEITPKIQSITSVLNLGCSINIKSLSQKIKRSEINLNNKNSLIIKTKDNNIINNIYPNGKVISTGAKSEKEAKSNCIKIAKIIKKFGYDISLKDYKIQNIVANYEINFGLNLNKLYKNICEFHINNYCKYDKNIFPGLIIYINDINVTIFEAGNIVISGAKNKKDIEKIFKEIYPLLNEAKT